MRPPSYYASIVKSNTSAYGSGSYANSSSDSYSTPRTSSQQLRSSLSSPSSSNYVSRSHLPFVPQSTLVAHCFTGVGSSTRPYGSSSPSARSPSYRTSRGTSPSYSATSSYTHSRPSSTNRRTAYAVSSTPTTSGYSSSASLTSSYLSPSSAAISSRSYPRPTPTTTTTTTTSSYYKPIRLRERPLLTQISRQLPSRVHNYTPSATKTTRDHHHSSHATSELDATKSERDNDKDGDETRTTRLALPSDEAKATAASQQDESNWSSDIGRNISRNKYLIKFREFDKHSRPSVDVEATIQLPPVEVNLRDKSQDRDSCVPDRDIRSPSRQEPRASLTVEHTMRLPSPGPVALASQADDKESEQTCDMKKPDADLPDQPAKSEAKKERKNVKLKLKPIGGGGGVGGLTGGKKKKSELAAEATTTTTVTDSAQVVAIAKKLDVNSRVEKAQPDRREATDDKTREIKKPIERTPEATHAVIVTPTLSGRPQKPVESKKAVKTSVSKDKRTTESTRDTDDNKENKSVPLKVKTDIHLASDPSPEPTQVATLKLRRGSKVATPIVTEYQQTSKVGDVETSETPTEKAKTKIIKKKKKTKQEDESATPSGKAPRRRSSSAVPKETVASQVNEVRVTPATPETAVANTPPTPSKQPARIRFREYNINDFNFLTVLGHGGWGFVILAELKEHDACFAIKCIKKITIVEDDDYDSIMIERKMLTLGNIHPFICKLFCTFETPGYLFFVMEYCAGGDLMFHVQHEGKFTEPRCRFYAAEIICAIRFLHNRHIIYRDLKLDNILLDAQGHIRLVDFGMCQCRTYREEMLPSNFCGTPEYISPEIIKGVPYNHSVDWWSFGVLLYEMAVGKMPFRGNDENELLWNVCYEQIHYPMFLTKELTALLKSLLEREPTKRMGMATCKAGDIYDQPFFRSVDWKAVEELRVEPPFVPEVKSNRDVSNFDSDFTESTCELSPVDDSTLARIDQKQFEKFPYTNPDIFIFDPTQQQPIVDHQPRGAGNPKSRRGFE